MGKAIDYSALLAGDVVLTGGTSLFATVIRWITGGKGAKAATTATHSGIIIDVWGQKLVAEMLGDGLMISSLEEYRNKKDKFIVGIGRVPMNQNQRDAICQRVSVDRRRTIEYDWSGDFAFVFNKVNQKPGAYFCSEYVASILKEFSGVSVKTEKPGLCSPMDLYNGFKNNTCGHFIPFEV